MARILVVEDEMLVRELACEDLEEAGYTVVSAGSGDEAAELFERGEEFEILFTDVRMPGSLDGVALADLAQARSPEIKVIFASGLPLEGRGPSPNERQVRKPYQMQEILRMISDFGLAP